MPGKIRFAPSPTGYLHEGHLLSALYVWAAAKKWDLSIHLRIEDHDQSRARPEYIRSIYEDLEWFGFEYDSDSIQSTRKSVYEAALEKLKREGLVYPCYCSRKQLEAENPKSATGEVVYQGKCRRINTSMDTLVPTALWCDEQEGTLVPSALRCDGQGKTLVPTALRCDGQPHNLRVIVPDETIHWHDLRLGDFDENPKKQCGDFPIRDRDGQWTYQFAVCVDDIDERITHVVRGEDILSSTARQIALMRMLGRETPPAYLHHPLIVDSTGKKLSKRELAHSLRQDREAGLSRETLLGRVCFKAGLAASPAPIGLANAIYLIYQIL
jgi:glutamyl-tRNA synthetase/glutamyl-Q tRNA(Asp) synthetase